MGTYKQIEFLEKNFFMFNNALHYHSKSLNLVEISLLQGLDLLRIMIVHMVSSGEGGSIISNAQDFRRVPSSLGMVLHPAVARI